MKLWPRDHTQPLREQTDEERAAVAREEEQSLARIRAEAVRAHRARRTEAA